MNTKTPHRSPAGGIQFSALLLDVNAATPLTKQVEEQIRAAILEGHLCVGERLPSTRQLAIELGIARNTVKNAFSQLIAEGYLEAAAGAGTRVAKELPETQLQFHAKGSSNRKPASGVRLSARGRKIASYREWIARNTGRPLRPFLPNTPASDTFPKEIWAKLTTQRLRQMSERLLERGDPQGYAPLRQTISDYLAKYRGISCGADQIFITAGAQQGIEMLAQLLVHPGETVCLENPGYTPARFLFEMAGAEIQSVPVDANGISIKSLHQTAPQASAVYVTPNSQFPMGVTMPLSRRLGLIEWARTRGAMIIEDDYNGEYRYAGRLLPALYGLVPDDQPAVYIGSFSKLLFPSLRIGYLVVPSDLIEPLSAARWLSDRHSPVLEQAVLCDFIREGHFSRHVRRMRMIYAKRQSALIDAGKRHLLHIMDLPPLDSSLHLIGRLRTEAKLDHLLQAASRCDLEITPVSWFMEHEAESNHVMLGYAPFTERELEDAAKRLGSAYTEFSG